MIPEFLEPMTIASGNVKVDHYNTIHDGMGLSA